MGKGKVLQHQPSGNIVVGGNGGDSLLLENAAQFLTHEGNVGFGVVHRASGFAAGYILPGLPVMRMVDIHLAAWALAGALAWAAG
ncbi:hypothetical protein D3C71_1986750 [compost metagenome]